MAAPRKRRSTSKRPTKASVKASWRTFFETPEGRIAINAMMAQFGVYSQITAVDGTSLAMQVGERNVAAWVAEMCGMKPEIYVEERSDTDRLFADASQFAYQ